MSAPSLTLIQTALVHTANSLVWFRSSALSVSSRSSTSCMRSSSPLPLSSLRPSLTSTSAVPDPYNLPPMLDLLRLFGSGEVAEAAALKDRGARRTTHHPPLLPHPHTPYPLRFGLDILADLCVFPCYSDKPSEVEGFPQRSWHMELWLVSEKPENKGSLVPANVFDKVTFNLHPSFGARATQGMHWSLDGVAFVLFLSSVPAPGDYLLMTRMRDRFVFRSSILTVPFLQSSRSHRSTSKRKDGVSSR